MANAFHRYGETLVVPRNEHVDLHVRQVTLNANAPTAKQVEAVEIREFIKAPEVYGHGLVFPGTSLDGVIKALQKVQRHTNGDKRVTHDGRK